MRQLKAWVKRHWPRLRLRTLVFATLFFVAALPGFAAMFLRVYENTLVRQTESELIAQGAALTAAAAVDWPGAPASAPLDPHDLRPEPPSIDLNSAAILPERPKAECARYTFEEPPGWIFEGANNERRLAPVLAATRRTTLASIVLLDEAGRLAGSTCSYAFLPEVRSALAARPATVLRRAGSYRQVYAFEWLSRAAAIRVHHTRPIVVGGRVVGVLLLSRSARSLFRGIYEDRGKILFGIAAILAALVVLTALLSRGITLPIERLGHATRAVASGRGQVPEVPATAAIEIQGLYADFATMAAAIERRSHYLRDIAYAISHEFKTPLAAIRGAVELLEDHPAMAEADRHRFLANIHADSDRLAQLVTRLLDLARADMTEAAGGATAIAPVVARVADAQPLPVEVALPDDQPVIAVPATSLQTVLATLLENSRQAGASHVTMSAKREDGWLCLRVADNGPGVSPADAARLFEPFFTTRRSDGGTGLGLTIAVSLLAAAGAEIAFVPGGGGATFELRLPVGRSG